HTLHQKFDVADSSWAEFDVEPRDRRSLPRTRRQLLPNAVARFRYRLHSAEIGGRRIDHGLDVLEEIASQIAVPCRNTSLDQHLQLPVPASRLVVFPRAVERAANLPVFPVGP